MTRWLVRLLRRILRLAAPASPEAAAPQAEPAPPPPPPPPPRQQLPVPLTYEQAKSMAASPDAEVRRQLACNPATQPEFLVFLAADTSPAVRREIAANSGTPVQAQILLAGDEDEEVRLELARKIDRLLPYLGSSESERISAMALKVLEKLAQDTLPRVRAMVAEVIKSADNVPPSLVRDLAFDLEAVVSCPILEYSPLLSDADLLEIITTGAVSDRLSAIARRSSVSPTVSEAVVATFDVPAVAALLANPSAQIREETLETVIASAAAIEQWHEPLVMRAELSVRAMRRVSEFVAASLIAKLAERHDLDAATQAELRATVRRRLIEASPSSTGAGEAAQRKAEEMYRAGTLNESVLLDALDRGERDFVMTGLILMSRLPAQVVRRIIATRTAGPVTALCWRAGLSMRTAMAMQLRLAHVPPKEVLNAVYGVDYPLTPAELERQLELFTG